MIEMMPEILQWQSGEVILRRIYTEYVELLAGALGTLLADLKRGLPDLSAGLTEALDRLTDEALARVLTAPEISNRLLWRSRNDLIETAHFLIASCEAEIARTNYEVYFDKPTWSAVGDISFYPNGGIMQFPQIEGFMPLDFGSPYAERIDLSGESAVTSCAHERFSAVERAVVYNKLRAACSSISQTSKLIGEFVSSFNIVLIVQKDVPGVTLFSSGSTRQHIGRSTLGNPQNATVEDIANAIVHEGIHGLLYMQEAKSPWVTNPELCNEEPRFFSPWTGRKLPLRPFLQACFVWYGLLHFWSIALRQNSFDKTACRIWLQQSLLGFLREPHLDLVADCLDDIAGPVSTAIKRMQEAVRRVTTELGETAELRRYIGASA